MRAMWGPRYILAGEELEIGVVDPALAHAFIGQPVNVFEQSPLLVIERGDLAIDPVPINLAGKLRQLMLEADDLAQSCSEQIA